MQRRVIRVEEALAGRTVARVLHDEGEFSHAAARGLIAAGGVERNGRTVTRVDERVAAGDRIVLSYEPGRGYRAPAGTRLHGDTRVVYEDRELVVVDKPAGLLTVPTPSKQGSSLQEELADSYRARGIRDPLVQPVHRIDRHTSGLVTFARTRPAWLALREQFAAGSPERVYLAVAAGSVRADAGRLVHRLEEDPKSLKVRPTVATRSSRPASCTYRVLERFTVATYLEVRLETGRRNQIRVQLAAEGHPILGDRAYGQPSPRIDRTALHAATLGFVHPVSGRALRFESRLPADLRKLLTALRREAHSETSTSTPE